MKKALVAGGILLSVFNFCLAQNKYPQDYFRSPLDIPLYISGNFGEIRSNHFHSGIDIKTQGVEGKNVYAIADGYISRIKIESGGYGRALYITHPNGYVSVYAHLKEFNSTIEAYIKKQQYAQKVHAIDHYPPKGTLPVAKGDVIALSGNSGRSFGAHLHFEIRDALTQFPLNVLLFNFNIKDDIKPVPSRIIIYPLSPNSHIDNSSQKVFFNVAGGNGSFYLENNSIPKLTGNIGFGLEAFDYLNGVTNQNGIYAVNLLIDSALIYSHQLERFSFLESRYINSFIDYEERIKTGDKIQKAYIEPNNKLSIYRKCINNGVYEFLDADTHFVKVILKDAYNNTSEINFKVKSSVSTSISDNFADTNFVKVLYYNAANTFDKYDIKVYFPIGSFYDNIHMTYAKTPAIEGCYSWIHHLHSVYTPVHKKYSLRIKPDNLPTRFFDKALIVRINGNNTFISMGGQWKNGFVETTAREFGKFCVAIDTTAPNILPINIKDKADMTYSSGIDFKVTDNLSGINSYNGYIDNQWVLFEYDAKNDLISYNFDPDRLQRGKQHTLTFYVSDEKNNLSNYKCTFTW
ncbi:MAG: M23 family metallopeptidase [Bacteroidales bacterium]|nr:M23 family metallopeptidase [Bacteroidales bacterium]